MRHLNAARLFAALLALTILAGRLPPARAQAPVVETFEGASSAWAVTAATAGGGSVTRSVGDAAGGAHAARLSTAGAADAAAVYATFSEPASAHTWNERPGTWHWQRASVYVPTETVNALSGDEYLTLAGLYPSSDPAGYGWYLRVGQGGALSVVGARSWDGQQIAFDVFGAIPPDRWVDLELGLHSQNGPGVKRAFAFLVDGSFYGWYRQGRLEDETYDRAAFGIVSTDSAAPLAVYVDQWRQPTTDRFPDGPDARPTAALQEQDYRSESGALWQIDWGTWENNLTLHPQHGLYSQSFRLQSGRSLDRMPSVADGWGEIEIGWPNGTPPPCTSTYCAAMIGFRKDVNREENLEIIPWADSDGVNYLVLEAWTDGGPQILARWQMPAAAAAPGQNIQEPGDIVRARWEQVSAADLNVRASYYDASAGRWFDDIINHTFDATNVNGVNYFDGYHEASSITIDSISYSIRRFAVGTLETYGNSVIPAHADNWRAGALY